MADLRLIRYSFEKHALRDLPKGLAAFVTQGSILADEINLFLKTLIMMSQPNQADKIKRDADVPIAMELLRQLAAVLSKSWEAYRDADHERARVHNEAQWDSEAAQSLIAIRTYFSNKANNVDRIRNDLTYHHRMHVLMQAFQRIPGEEPLVLYTGSHIGNFRSSAAYLFAGDAMLKGIGNPQGVSWDDLWKELLALAEHFQIVYLGHLAAFLKQIKPRTRRKVLKICGAPRIRSLVLTHFTAEPRQPGADGRTDEGIRMTRINFSKCQLATLGEDLALYTVQAGVLLHLIILWWKLMLMCGNAESWPVERERANVALHGYLVRRLAGELHEAWIALTGQRPYRDLPVWSERVLPPEAVDALKQLRLYFAGEGGEWLESIRKEYTHHSDFSRIRKDLDLVSDDRTFDLVFAKGQKVVRFATGEVTGDKLVFPKNRIGAIKGLEDEPQREIAQVARWFRVLLKAQIEAVIPAGASAEEILIRDVPHLEDLSLPYWVAK